MNQIVTVNASEFGLEETKAQQIAAQFKPMLDKMVELEKEYNEVIVLPIEDPASASKAKELRLKYVKVRTGTAAIHKEQKDFYLAGGRYVDGWKNAQLFASQGIEKKLEEIEKYAETKERERIANLQSERQAILSQYEIDNLQSLQLGTMPDNVFEAFLTTSKANFEAKKEAERIAEEERIAKEKADAEARELQRLENIRLKAEAEAREKEIAKERAKAEADRKAQEEKARKEREAVEAKLKAEAEARAKAEAELKAKQQAEEKAKSEEEARIQAEIKAKEKAERKAKSAPDKAKLIEFANLIDLLNSPEMSSEEGKNIIADSRVLLVKVSNFIREKSVTL
jgi:uncharacterized membrane protein YqiK